MVIYRLLFIAVILKVNYKFRATAMLLFYVPKRVEHKQIFLRYRAITTQHLKTHIVNGLPPQ